MRSSEELGEVRRLQALGLNDSEIAGQTAVPRSTVRAWRHAARRDEIGGPACDACGSPEHVPSALPARDYSYLLGLYFGDGCIVGFPGASTG